MSMTCPECGSSKWMARNFARVRDEATHWRRTAQRLGRRVKDLELDLEFEQFKDRTDVAWLQAKVVAQRRELKRLNDARNTRLIKDGFEPQPDKEVSSVTKTEVDHGPSEGVIG